MKKESIYKNSRYTPLLAIAAVLAWGFAYPLIKLGFEEFGIIQTDTGGKTLFAGIRFLLAGIFVLITSKAKHHSFKIKKSDIGLLVIFALVNTALHYFFFYIGVSNSFGARASVLDSLGTFLLVIIACIVFHDEHMTSRKIIGCAVGFAGLIILNIGSESTGHFTLSGDGMMVLNAFCAAFGGILTRIICKKTDALFATGAGLAIGGAILIIGGAAMGGRLRHITPIGVLILILLVCVSAIGFSIYNQLIKYNPVGKVAIYNSLIPVFGIILSCVFLREEFLVKYIFAGLLVAAGVFIINRQKD